MSAETAFKILVQLYSDKPEEQQFAAEIIEFANQTVLNMTRLVLQELVVHPDNVFDLCKLIEHSGLIDQILPDLIACYGRQTRVFVRYSLIDSMITLAKANPLVIDFAMQQLRPNTRLSRMEISINQTIMYGLIEPQLKQLDSALVLNSLIPIYQVNDRELATKALLLLSKMGEPAEFLIDDLLRELKRLARVYSSYASALVHAMSPEYLVKALMNFGTDAAIEGVIEALYLAQEASTVNMNSKDIVTSIIAELKKLDDERAKQALVAWDKAQEGRDGTG